MMDSVRFLVRLDPECAWLAVWRGLPVRPSGPATALALGLPQHADEHRSQRPVFLAVDQELGECAALG
jgi:hypothetical protein